MDLAPTRPTGSFLTTLIDQDIAHIDRVMLPSLHGDLGGAILPASYWRKRLYDLLDAEHLTKSQLCAVDSLLLQLEQLDSAELSPLPMRMAPPAAAHAVRRKRAARLRHAAARR
jgi:hypothetical protein